MASSIDFALPDDEIGAPAHDPSAGKGELQGMVRVPDRLTRVHAPASKQAAYRVSDRLEDRVQEEADALAVLREPISDADALEPEPQELEAAFSSRDEADLPLRRGVVEIVVTECEL